MMNIPMVSTCCCCCSPKTGTKIIGWINVIAWILFIARSVTDLAFLYNRKLDKKPDDIEVNLPLMPTLIHSRNDPTTTSWPVWGEFFQPICTLALIIYYVFQIVMSIILLVGFYKNKVQVLAYWCFRELSLLLFGIGVYLMVALASARPEILFDLLFIVLDLYFVLVVYSYCREMSSSTDPV